MKGELYLSSITKSRLEFAPETKEGEENMIRAGIIQIHYKNHEYEDEYFQVAYPEALTDEDLKKAFLRSLRMVKDNHDTSIVDWVDLAFDYLLDQWCALSMTTVAPVDTDIRIEVSADMFPESEEIPKPIDYYSLIIKSQESQTPYAIMTFDTASFVTDPEKNLRAAVSHFLSTPDGEKALLSNGGRFTWDDAMRCIPPDYYQRKGLSPANRAACVIVSGDEDLNKENAQEHKTEHSKEEKK